jgi:hypothetical protein
MWLTRFVPQQTRGHSLQDPEGHKILKSENRKTCKKKQKSAYEYSDIALKKYLTLEKSEYSWKL